MQILPGLTGIVGPNGCGKSNLVEALRWVMGESSAKRLRGGEMDDVIFAGAAGRPPRNQAEVTLRLANPDLNAPVQFNDATTLEVTRKVVRGQGSAYRVNGRDHRAQDLKLLFADLASGAASNAMVAQGRVAAIVNARPTDRRALLEEAAGITGLYSRRREAENRLRAAEQNLERVGDVQQAKQAQRKSLDRQADAARRYSKLQARRRALEAALAYLQWQEVEAALKQANAALASAEKDCERLSLAEAVAKREEDAASAKLEPLRLAHGEAAARLQRLDLALQALENEERGLEARREALARQLAECGDDLAREQDNVKVAAERLAALEAEEARLKTQRQASKPDIHRLEAELAEQELAERQASEALRDMAAKLSTLRNERSALEARIEALQARAKNLTQRLETLEQTQAFDGLDATAIDAQFAEQGDRQAALTGAQEIEAQAQAKLAEIRAAHATAAERVQEARAQVSRLEAEAAGLQDLLASPNASASGQTLGQVLQVIDDLGPAVAAALGDSLEAGLTSGSGDFWRPQSLPPAPALPKGIGSLQNAVEAPDWLQPLLAYVGVAADADQAAALQKALQPGQALTTPVGGLWRWDGFVAAQDRNAGQAALIARAQRLSQLGAQIEAAREVLTEAEAAQSLGQEKLAEAETQAKTATQSVREMQADLATLGKAISQAQRALADHRAKMAAKEAEQVGTQRELETVQAELRGLEQTKSDLDSLQALEAQVAAAQSAHETAQAQVHKGRGRLETAKRELISTEARLGAILTETFTFEGQHKNAQAQLYVLNTRAQGLEAEGRELAARPAALAAQRAELSDNRATAEQAQAAAGDGLAEAQTQLRRLRQTAQGAVAAYATAREERAKVQAEQSAAQDRVAEVARLAYETFKRPAADLLELAEARHLDDLPPRAQGEAELKRVERQIDLMGPVNLRAETELQEVEAELADLDREVTELTKAIAKLRRVIGELNQEGRARLKAAFDQVSTHFSGLFQRLFGGGKARLELVGAEDPLEAGLEIVASPPGKRLQSLTLLSGGEQTLTALALIFAMFRANPAPLCVLDEVDAPLDDANVDRLCSLLEDMASEVGTRFLIVTHNALTMARVDRLFGVTMAERGVSRLVSVNLEEAARYQEP